MRTIQLLTLTCCSLPLLTSCGSPTIAAPPSRVALPAPVAKNNTILPKLSAADKRKIGNKIWQNESGRKVSGLTAWNVGEEFPSLGIGHFIWYPKGYRGPFTESFPAFVRYAQQSRARGIPAWLLTTPDCPWQTRASFLADVNKPRLASLRTFLANNIDVQTDFIMFKSRSALQNMMSVTPVADRERVKANYAKVASASQ